eukprot:6193001-Pleurochrysis_carterae.AAC.4
MFYNALLRKGKGEGVQEKDMNAVVAIHNNMNERGWMQVAALKGFIACDCCPGALMGWAAEACVATVHKWLN